MNGAKLDIREETDEFGDFRVSLGAVVEDNILQSFLHCNIGPAEIIRQRQRLAAQHGTAEPLCVDRLSHEPDGAFQNEFVESEPDRLDGHRSCGSVLQAQRSFAPHCFSCQRKPLGVDRVRWHRNTRRGERGPRGILRHAIGSRVRHAATATATKVACTRVW